MTKLAFLFAIASTLSAQKQQVNFIPVSSTDFGAGEWHLVNLAVHPNAISAPDGSQAQGIDDIVDPTADPGSHFLYSQADGTPIPLPSAPNHCSFSVFLKAGSHSKAMISLWATLQTPDPSGNTYYLAHIYVDLAAGIVTMAEFPGTPFISSVGNGWYRVGVGFATLFPHQRFVSAFPTVAPINDSGSIGYFSAGDSNALYIWGAQIDKGITPMAYQAIP